MIVIKWFIIPWIVFILVFTAYMFFYKEKLAELKPFPDLSSINTNELLEMDVKRAISEGVNKKENMPHYYKGGSEIGFLLIHGFTASPYEMSFLAKYLNSKGYYVYNARVAGHGSNPENLNVLTYEDWYESLKYGYFVLKKNCKKIFVVGQSMGGLLAYNLSVLNNVEGAVLLSPALGIKSIKFSFIPILKNFVNFVEKEDFDSIYQDYYYRVRPVKGLYQLYLLIDYTWSMINKKSFPVYIIYSAYDDIISNKEVERFYNKLQVSKKKIDLIKQKDIKHILTLNDNPEAAEEIFKKIEKWVRED